MNRNRIYRADCKATIDTLLEEQIRVDLIYLDPPFNSNRTYSILFQDNGVTAQQKSYHDMWDFTDRTRQLVLDFRTELDSWDLDNEFKQFMRLWISILESRTSAEKKLLNYLMYMTRRLIKFRRILKPTGSIYLHCDPTVSHYLKIIMDGIFGFRNFRNEITWKRMSAHNDAKRWGRVHDVILFYTMSDDFTWTGECKLPYDPDYLKQAYSHRDSRGRYTTSPLQARSLSRGGYSYEWKGINDIWKFPKHRLDELEANDEIHWPQKQGGTPRRKVYLDPNGGVPVQDVITDITIKRRSTEYPTKKPALLLERIIQSSTAPGEIVLDPFCGCGTSIIASEKLKRRWIGIDISGNAVDEICGALAQQGLYKDRHYDLFEGQPDTMSEYNRLNPFEKQEWLIRQLGGLPNPKMSDDKGVDGDLEIHLGIDGKGNDQWGRVVFSVKTGEQRKPEHIRELRGTMKNENAQIGVLILDKEPTDRMEQAAEKAGQLRYQMRKDMPPKEYDRLQILTSFEIVEGAKMDCPPTLQEVLKYREVQAKLEV